MRHPSLLATCAFLLASCGSSGGDPDAGDDAVEDPTETADTLSDPTTDGSDPSGPPPAAPAEDDPAFTVVAPSAWLMEGDGLTPTDTHWTATVTAPAGVDEIHVWVEGDGPRAFTRTGEGFDVAVDVEALTTGTYTAILAEPGATVGFAARTFHVSHACYVLMATDWDDADNAQSYLDNMDTLRAWHPELRYSHYFGPYTLTDPALSPARRTQLVDWITERRDTHGDEIGVHLHPRCSFVDTTTVNCRHEPSDVYAWGDPTGYTVIVASYTVEEMTTLLVASADVFMSYGLGRPTSFRAGGWTTDEGTLEAIVAAGYTVDADAIVAARIEEWEGQGNGVFYEWLMEHWGDIGIDSQPYYPSLTDASQPATGADAFDVLQIPANAVIVDYVTAEEMLETFEHNWPDHAPLDEPITWHTGLHPPNFAVPYLTTLDTALDTVDLYLHSTGTGPVRYATASEMRVVWPSP